MSNYLMLISDTKINMKSITKEIPVPISIQNELIKLYGEEYNNINNLVEYLNKKYHPKYFQTIKDFCNHCKSVKNKNMTIDDYTDDYITNADSYFIILFDDYRDFAGAQAEDNFSDDVVVCYDPNTKHIKKYYYTGIENDYLQDIDAFIK